MVTEQYVAGTPILQPRQFLLINSAAYQIDVRANAKLRVRFETITVERSAGMIAGLAARGVFDPAATAAWLHQECGRHLGPGLIAEDIPEAIPSVLKRILEWEAPED